MLLDSVNAAASHYFVLLNSSLGKAGLPLLGLAIAWSLWRVWAFTLVPILRPKQPRTIPYSIPLLGHTLSFLKNPDKVINYAHKYFAGDEPYAIQVGPMKLVIVRNVNDVSAVWKNTKAFTFDNFIQRVYYGMGIPESSYRNMFADLHALPQYNDPQPKFISENPNKKKFIDIQEDWMKEQLQPGARMENVLGKMLDGINDRLNWSRLPSKCLISDGKDAKTISLLDLCRYTLVEASVTAFMGPELFEIDPDFVQHYLDWENTAWKVAHQYPAFLARDMIKARDIAVDALEKFYSMPKEKRPNITWMNERMQTEQQRVGLSCREAASIGFLMLWGVNQNAPRMVFWDLAHILCDRSLFNDVLREVEACKVDGVLDANLLKDKCPVLDAVWNEGLRLYANSAVARMATTPVQLRGTVIEPGTTVMGIFKTFSLSEDFVGPNPHTFDARRWLKDPNLVKNKAWFPFSGGKTHCPGRVIAKVELFYFIATLLTRYHVEPLEGPRKGTDETGMPLVAFDNPSLGVLNPAVDVKLRVSPKAST